MGVPGPDLEKGGWLVYDGQAISGPTPPNGLAWSVVPCHKIFNLAKNHQFFCCLSFGEVLFISDKKMAEVGPRVLRN